MKRIDLERWLPLGVSVERIRGLLLWSFLLAALYTLRFFLHLSRAVDMLYVWMHGKKVLMEGAVLAPFETLLPYVFSSFGIIALCMPVAAVGLYLYHYMGGRSIYTMRRLPDPWELWRRCLAVPVSVLLLCGICVLLLTGLYYACYCGINVLVMPPVT